MRGQTDRPHLLGQRLGAAGVTADHGDPADPADRAHRLDMAPRLRSRAEHHEVLHLGGREHVRDGRRHRRGAQGRQGDAVEEGNRAERGGIHQQVDALDAFLAESGVTRRHRGHLHAHEFCGLGRHQQQLASVDVQDAAGEVGRRVESAAHGGLQRAHRGPEADPGDDLVGGEPRDLCVGSHASMVPSAMERAGRSRVMKWGQVTPMMSCPRRGMPHVGRIGTLPSGTKDRCSGSVPACRRA